jgi:hypothetical protein
MSRPLTPAGDGWWVSRLERFITAPSGPCWLEVSGIECENRGRRSARVAGYSGIDWAETHHDVAVVDETGQQLVKRWITDDLAGFTALTHLLVEVTSADVADEGGGTRFVPWRSAR